MYILTKFLRNYDKVEPLPAIEMKNNQKFSTQHKFKRLNSPGINSVDPPESKRFLQEYKPKLERNETKVSRVWEQINVSYKLQTISDSWKMAPTSLHYYLWKLLHVTKLAVTYSGWEENRYLCSTSVRYKDVLWKQ